jgi:hypothetical protein
MVCAAALLGIWLIIGSVALYVPNRALAAHGVRTQGQVVEAYADLSDEVVYTVDGTDHEVPEPALCERCPTRNGPSRIRCDGDRVAARTTWSGTYQAPEFRGVTVPGPARSRSSMSTSTGSPKER